MKSLWILGTEVWQNSLIDKFMVLTSLYLAEKPKVLAQKIFTKSHITFQNVFHVE